VNFFKQNKLPSAPGMVSFACTCIYVRTIGVRPVQYNSVCFWVYSIRVIFTYLIVVYCVYYSSHVHSATISCVRWRWYTVDIVEIKRLIDKQYVTCLLDSSSLNNVSIVRRCTRDYSRWSPRIFRGWLFGIVVRSRIIYYQCKKNLISLKHSVRATYVMPLKQQKSLCLTLWFAKLQLRPYKTSCCVEHCAVYGYFHWLLVFNATFDSSFKHERLYTSWVTSSPWRPITSHSCSHVSGKTTCRFHISTNSLRQWFFNCRYLMGRHLFVNEAGMDLGSQKCE